MSKSFICALICTVALAALMGAVGGGPDQPRPCQARQYPASSSPAWTPAPARSRTPVHLREVEEWLRRLTNEIRRQYGLPPLRQDAKLTALARAHSDDMLLRRFFSHTNPEGRGAQERLQAYYGGALYGFGENIWMGSNLSTANSQALARTIINSWMSSPGHRDNLLGPDFTHCGVGVAARGGEIRATQIFVRLQHN